MLIFFNLKLEMGWLHEKVCTFYVVVHGRDYQVCTALWLKLEHLDQLVYLVSTPSFEIPFVVNFTMNCFTQIDQLILKLLDWDGLYYNPNSSLVHEL